MAAKRPRDGNRGPRGKKYNSPCFNIDVLPPWVLQEEGKNSALQTLSVCARNLTLGISTAHGVTLAGSRKASWRGRDGSIVEQIFCPGLHPGRGKTSIPAQAYLKLATCSLWFNCFSYRKVTASPIK